MITKNSIPFSVFLPFIIIFLLSSHSCEPKPRIAYKPNIYIYPQEEMELSVKLDFPMGGTVINSIPDYGDGWNISIDTIGIIDNSFSYLFYESIQPDIWQDRSGWIVKKSELEEFFIHNMADYGFSGAEIDDFTEYWLPRLEDSDFYAIYPQNKEIIDDVIKLKFSETPDHILRLFYVIKEIGGERGLSLSEPIIDTTFSRTDFFVAEWGVIIDL